MNFTFRDPLSSIAIAIDMVLFPMNVPTSKTIRGWKSEVTEYNAQADEVEIDPVL